MKFMVQIYVKDMCLCVVETYNISSLTYGRTNMMNGVKNGTTGFMHITRNTHKYNINVVGD